MMKKFLISTLFCLAAVSTAVAATPGEVPEGGQLRDVLVRGLTGEPRTFSSFRGKPLIINMWASYCSPCLAEMGSLERLSQRLGKRANVIGISIDDYTDRAQGFLTKVTTTFPHFIDHRLTVENMLGANRIPLTVLVDADGRILHKVYGAKEWDSPEIVKAVEEAFGFRK